MEDITIFEKIKKAENLPQLPQVMLRLIKACNSEKTSIEELTQIISADPSLTSRLLQIIGSPYINLPKEVNSIKTAVVYLGIDTIRNIAISTSAMRFFKFSQALEGFDMGKFWHHSYKSAVIAQIIVQENELSNSDELFLAGLLHDIGRLVLMRNFPKEYQIILKTATTERQILAAEMEMFKADTPQVSAWLFRQWNLNPLISDAVLFINEEMEQIESALSHVKIIYSANILAGHRGDEKLNVVSDLVGLSPAGLEQIVLQADQAVEEMAKSLGIDLEQPFDQIDEKELSDEIQDLSLFFGTLQNLLNAKNMESVLDIAQNGLKILFNIPRVFYFLLDEKKNILTGYCSTTDKSHKIIKSIALPLSNQTSLLIKCHKDQQVQNSLKKNGQKKIAISDTQIIRLLEAPGLYCIPIYSSQKVSGVMALGVDDHMAKRLDKSEGLVRLFSKQTGVCLHSIRFHNEYANNIHEMKMEAYATLTDKVIHEVNNPIAIVKNYIETLSLKLPDKHPTQNELSIISEEMTRMSGLLDKLRSFSRPRIDGFEPIDINQLCQSILEILKKTILLPQKIDASISIDPEIPLIKTDRNGLKQVFINLIKNAAEAMYNGGKIRVKTRFLPESSKIMIDEKKRIPGNIEIVFSDNGPGIDDTIKETLFEPYTTTKTGPGPSGLGLSIVHSIIKELNGSIACQSKKGKGTRFVITLPVSSSKKKA
ncbi:MAG: HDOD domain-containing protein [Desulfobacula sp.]|nr:HDOD domain-containing protein [Desulfobacula sp.]